MRWWDLHCKPLAPDLAVALYQVHWNGDIKGFDGLVGIDSRVTAVFRRRETRCVVVRSGGGSGLLLEALQWAGTRRWAVPRRGRARNAHAARLDGFGAGA